MIRAAPGTVEGVAEAVFDSSENPQGFFIRTVNEYDVPLVRPVTVQLRSAGPAEQVAPPGDAVTTNPINGPLVLDEAVQLTTLLDETLDVATTPVGAGGRPAGMDSPEATDSADFPLALVAVTLNV
jgi:hypothetical protein